MLLIPAGVGSGCCLSSSSVESRLSVQWQAFFLIHCPVLVLRAFIEVSQTPAANPFVPGHIARHHDVDLYVFLRSRFSFELVTCE